MKRTVKKELIEKASELTAIIEQRKSLEKRESELKDLFKSFLDTEKACQVGEYLISLDDRQRKDLDKDYLREYLKDSYSQFEKVSSYQVFNIKKVG